jgi:hypothetical protein
MLCSGNVLQRLASDEITPPANLWRDDAFLLLRDLLAHALSEKDGSPWLHEKRDAKIDGYKVMSAWMFPGQSKKRIDLPLRRMI